MNVHPARLVASVLLVAGGFVVAVSALAVVFASILVYRGMTVRPADAALLADLVPVLPFVVAFALANIVAAIGLLTGKSWADLAAAGSAVVAITAGAIGLTLVVVGRDPFASTAAARSAADGIGILGVFTVFYLAIIAALAAAQLPQRAASGAAA